MRKFSLVFAAAVMAVGLAVSGSASAEDLPSNYEVLAEGEILMKSYDYDNPAFHYFTVHYDGAIYACNGQTKDRRKVSLQRLQHQIHRRPMAGIAYSRTEKEP